MAFDPQPRRARRWHKPALGRTSALSHPPMHSRDSSRLNGPLAQRVAEDADSRQIADAIGAMWADIQTALQPVLGQRGVAALFWRTLHVTATRHPCLAPLKAESADAATELMALLAALQPAIAMEAGSALLVNFRELLAALIGTSLTERLLQAAWSTSSSAPPAQDPKP